jgi:hypothetical protein
VNFVYWAAVKLTGVLWQDRSAIREGSGGQAASLDQLAMQWKQASKVIWKYWHRNHNIERIGGSSAVWKKQLVSKSNRAGGRCIESSQPMNSAMLVCENHASLFAISLSNITEASGLNCNSVGYQSQTPTGICRWATPATPINHSTWPTYLQYLHPTLCELLSRMRGKQTFEFCWNLETRFGKQPKSAERRWIGEGKFWKMPYKINK